MVTVPFLFTFTTRLITPFWFDGLVRTLIFGPVMRTRTPLTGLPCLPRWMVSLVLWPTKSRFGLTLRTLTQMGRSSCWQDSLAEAVGLLPLAVVSVAALP